MKKIVLFISSFVFLTVSGCSQPDLAPPLYGETQTHVAASQNAMEKLKKEDSTPNPIVVENSGMYVDAKPVSLDRPPAWLNNRITIHGNSLPMSFYASKILQGTGYYPHYDHTVKSAKDISFDYKGTVKGALRALAADTGYVYTVDQSNKMVSWSAFETRTFNISFMPGSADYMIGQSQSSGGSSSSSSSSGGSGGSDTTQVTATEANPDDQYSSLSGKSISLWKDLETAVKGLLSKQGTVSVSEATTSVTVHDYPENVAAITSYLDQMNKFLSKQVRLQVQVWQIQLSKAFDYGINWNLVAGDLVVQGNLATPVNISPIGTTTAMGVGYNALTTSSGGSSAEILFQALSQQGKMSVVTQPTVVTLNNQVAEIDISEQKGYLASSSSTLSGFSANSQSTLTPGQATTGFTMYVLPKVEGQKIFLQISSTLSVLQQIETISSGGTGLLGGGAQQIQVPDIAAQKFNQRAVVQNGNMLILSGYKQASNEANQSDFFGLSILGGKGAQHANIETIIVITPKIIGKQY